MPLRSTKDYSVGIIYFILFILTIPAMNWVVMNVGTVCTADGPCLIPVWTVSWPRAACLWPA